MLENLAIALKKFNDHAGHNCKLVFTDNGEIQLYQTYGKKDCKHWDYTYFHFYDIDDCIEWLYNN